MIHADEESTNRANLEWFSLLNFCNLKSFCQTSEIYASKFYNIKMQSKKKLIDKFSLLTWQYGSSNDRWKKARSLVRWIEALYK